MKLLDCTIRDGGYYTNWDFDNDLIVEYSTLMESLPIDYVEVGYRSPNLEGYLGKYYYCPLYVLEELKDLMPSKKLVIILNEKDIKLEYVNELLSPIKPFITLVRMAVDPKNFKRAIILAKAIKSMGFEVALNVMYMSNWKSNSSFLNLLNELDNTLDFFYMVDSFGGVFPNEVKEIIKLVKSKTKVPLGFHGHDNLSMGLINSITAMEEGCEIIDSTITGMGRGAGNLKTELLLTYLESQNKIKINFNLLTQVVDSFSLLQKKHQWGSSLPYMVSGAYSLPQKDVMSWVMTGKYSFNTIIRALKNLSKGIEDNENFKSQSENFEEYSVMLVGGGPSVSDHFNAIRQFLNNNQSVILVHASSKHSKLFKEFLNKQYFCLVGHEGYRMENVFEGNYNENISCVLPPFPRTMGTFVPNSLMHVTSQLEKYDFTNANINSHTSVALQLTKNLKCKNVFVIGYDGYNDDLIDNRKQELLDENNKLFKDFSQIKGISMLSLFDTVYPIPKYSIYSKIS